jgi:hypothetical protein
VDELSKRHLIAEVEVGPEAWPDRPVLWTEYGEINLDKTRSLA